MGPQTKPREWERIFACERANDPLTEKAHTALVGSLLKRRAALGIGALTTSLASAAVAFISDNALFYALTSLLSVIAMLRIVNAIQMAERPGGASATRRELAYKLGAFAFSLVLGLIAASAVVLEIDPMAQVLIISNAIGYAIGICANNAARPSIAFGQLTLVSVPILCASLVEGSTASIFLAVTIAMLFPAMYSIVSSIFRALRDSLQAADRSAALAAEMEILALTDPVTGLPNRPALDRRLPQMLEQAEDRHEVAIFWLDLHRFKEVNDLKGHHAGDAVLQTTGERLVEIVGKQNIVARFAGDEFVIASSVKDRHDAAFLASRLLNEVQCAMRVEGDTIRMDASIGVALMPDDGTTAEELMRHADLALFEAKTVGRSQIRFFTPAMTSDLQHRRKIETELRLAIERNQLSVYFQPIVDLETGNIRCFEALARWFHPEMGEIRPDVFIPIAEDCGAIVALGDWLTGEAARVAASWPSDVRIAVNLSPLQIRAPGSALGILRAIRAAGLPPERLELEVTENLFVENSPHIASFIEELSRAGVRFALDDFGAGYSSLGYISQWPFAKIKVDRSFVSGCRAGRKSDAIIRAISEMGRTLGIEIVAEGIETPRQGRTVRTAGCTLGQGYHFGRPMPGDAATQLLVEERNGGADGHRRAMVG